jgi:hypothetical protein
MVAMDLNAPTTPPMVGVWLAVPWLAVPWLAVPRLAVPWLAVPAACRTRGSRTRLDDGSAGGQCQRLFQPDTWNHEDSMEMVRH